MYSGLLITFILATTIQSPPSSMIYLRGTYRFSGSSLQDTWCTAFLWCLLGNIQYWISVIPITTSIGNIWRILTIKNVLGKVSISDYNVSLVNFKLWSDKTT